MADGRSPGLWPQACPKNGAKLLRNAPFPNPLQGRWVCLAQGQTPAYGTTHLQLRGQRRTTTAKAVGTVLPFSFLAEHHQPPAWRQMGVFSRVGGTGQPIGGKGVVHPHAQTGM